MFIEVYCSNMSSYLINKVVAPDEGIGLGEPATAPVPTPVRRIEETPTLIAFARVKESFPLIPTAAKFETRRVCKAFDEALVTLHVSTPTPTLDEAP